MSENLPAAGEFLVSQAEDGRVRLEDRLEHETVWLTQHLMAELFQTSKQNISLQIRNIFAKDEHVPEATHKKNLSVRREGSRDVRASERQVLPNAGSASKKAAEEHARQEYGRFAERRREFKESLGEGKSIRALEEAAKLVGRKLEKLEDGE